MANAILTTKITPSYSDIPERQYHFPKTYLRQVERALGDFIVYYEPRRSSADAFSIGGRSAYFALARIIQVVEDPQLKDHYFAYMDSYLDFDRSVPFKFGNLYLESSLKKSDGSTNKGAFGRAVRLIPQDEFELILNQGFSDYVSIPPVLKEPWLDRERELLSVEDPGLNFQRPLIEVTSKRPFRDTQFRHKVRETYDYRCAVTGLQLRNGGGRPEVEAAHIIAVEDKGPDSIRNGLALSGTVHWMFDRGLISVDPDYRLIAAEGAVPDALVPLVTPGKRLLLPSDSHYWPHQFFLEHHRTNRFKGNWTG